jgi:hypothetical protein
MSQKEVEKRPALRDDAAMTKLKSALHHWWPECLSEHWADKDGLVHRLRPNGEIKRLPPSQFGAITNAHMIKLGRTRGSQTPWDENFEAQFDRADNAFPDLIRWLGSQGQTGSAAGLTLKDRFLAQPASDERLAMLTECVISLAVRSPMNRASAISLAEHFRGPIPEPARSALIGLNMRETQRAASDSVGGRAKFVVVYSPHREFIFGDGFFNNVRSPVNGIFLPRILAPLTPNMAVVIAKPIMYSTEPKLTTIVATPAETDALNEAVQVYACDFIFFRTDKPKVTEDFRVGEHRMYNGPNTVDNLINAIPGIANS